MRQIENKLQGSNIPASIKRTLTGMCAPQLVRKGEGEYGIGYQVARADMRQALEQLLGTYPWYVEQ